MICKVCGKQSVELEETEENFHAILAETMNELCHFCERYAVAYDGNGDIESECVRSSNFMLIFFPAYKVAWITNRDNINDKSWKEMGEVKMDELTPELAVKWANKLKTYAVFQ